MNGDFALLQQYAAILRAQPDHAAVAVLHIGAEHTSIVWGEDPERYASVLIRAGSHKTASDHFRHRPPAAPELESAIAAVEDEIMRPHALPPRGARLYTADPAILAMARLAGVDGEVLPVEEVERLFSRLAAISLGAPAVREALPTDPGFYATAVILRELMHHLGYASIALLPAQ